MFLLQGLGCFVAWNIRTVQADRPAVSGEHLTLSVFAVTVFSVTGASGSLLTSHNPPVQFCLTSVLILCCNMCTLSWLFGPKVSVTPSSLSSFIPLVLFWRLGWPTGFNSLQVLQVWLSGGELQGETAEGEDEEQLSRLNQQLKSQTAQVRTHIP